MRIKIETQQQAEAANDARKHLIKQFIKKGDGAAVSEHEILGIVTEEYHELIEAVTHADLKAIEAELNDLAAACMLGTASIKAWKAQGGKGNE